MRAAGWSAWRFFASLRAALGLAVVPALIALPAAAQSLRAFPPPFEIRVPVPPGPLASGGDHYLVYELLIKSFMPAPAQVGRVEVFAESSAGRRLLEYAGEELGENMLPPTSQEEDPVKRRTIGALSHGVVYVMLPISGSVTMPRQLFHRVWFDLPSGDSTVADYVDFETPIQASSVIEIGPPLKGGPWAVFNGPSNDSGHRRMPLQLFGRSAFAQRYAIDYMLVDAEGRAMPVEDGGNDTYPGYGEEVIAVADGVISTVFDGVPENTPGVTSRPWTSGTAAMCCTRTCSREARRYGWGSRCAAATCLAAWATPATREAPTFISISSTTTCRWGRRGCRSSTMPSSWWGCATRGQGVRVR